ncbi:hypothetical protein P7C70_g8536, partial [Phenoliferia sp. Uapishka_3]
MRSTPTPASATTCQGTASPFRATDAYSGRGNTSADDLFPSPTPAHIPLHRPPLIRAPPQPYGSHSTALTVLTPASITLCQPAAIGYSGGTAPYFLSVLPGGQVSAAALETFPSSSTTAAGSYTWNVNLPAGTSITLALKDSTGNIAYSGSVIIAPNTETSAAAVASTTAATTSTTSAAVANTSSTSSAAAGTTTSAARVSSAVAAVSSAVSTAAGTAASPPRKNAHSSLEQFTDPALFPSHSAASASAKPASAGSNVVNVLALVGAGLVAIVA